MRFTLNNRYQLSYTALYQSYNRLTKESRFAAFRNSSLTASSHF
uniref:Uncharacterized protein n=1 Tax=Rhizophora mucronata TaxID=61149 RepID=A0A2P2ND85_RHIMU